MAQRQTRTITLKVPIWAWPSGTNGHIRDILGGGRGGMMLLLIQEDRIWSGMRKVELPALSSDAVVGLLKSWLRALRDLLRRARRGQGRDHARDRRRGHLHLR